MSSRISSCGNSGASSATVGGLNGGCFAVGDGVCRRALLEQAGGAKPGQRAGRQRRAALRTFVSVGHGLVRFYRVHACFRSKTGGTLPVRSSTSPIGQALRSVDYRSVSGSGVEFEHSPGQRRASGELSRCTLRNLCRKLRNAKINSFAAFRGQFSPQPESALKNHFGGHHDEENRADQRR